MQIKLLTCAFAATSFAQSESSFAHTNPQPIPNNALPTLVSEIGIVATIFATALPSSLLELAATNTEAFESAIKSAIDPNNTPYPEWVTALPGDSKSILEADLAEKPSESSEGGAAMPTVVMGVVGVGVGLMGLLTL